MIDFESNRRIISQRTLERTSPQYERENGIWFSKEDAVSLKRNAVTHYGNGFTIERHGIYYPIESLPHHKLTVVDNKALLPTELQATGRSRLAQVGMAPISWSQEIIVIPHKFAFGTADFINFSQRDITIPRLAGVFRFFDVSDAKPLHKDEIETLRKEEDIVFRGRNGAWHYEDDHTVLFKVGTKRFTLKNTSNSIDVFTRNVKDIRRFLKSHEYDKVDETVEKANVIFAYTSFIHLPHGYHGVLDSLYASQNETAGVHIPSTLIEGGVSKGGVVVELAPVNQKRIKEDIWVKMKIYKDSTK